jgi:hypothetical protein
MKVLARLLDPRLWSAALIAIGARGAPATSGTVGAIPGVHGPPTICRTDDGSAVVVAYVIRKGKDADLFAWRLGHVLADSKWPKGGLAVCDAPGDQVSPVAISDGEGGAITVWNDFRSPEAGGIYAHHILNSGVTDPQWPRNGVPVCIGARVESGIQLVSDLQGGALVVWEDLRGPDYDVCLQHVLATGKADPAWPAAGRFVSKIPAARTSPVAVSDGSGGAIVIWQQDSDRLSTDLYAQHVLHNGDLDPAWPEAGLVVSSEPGDQTDLASIPDGAGGALVAWSDRRDGTPGQLYMGRVLASGAADPLWPVGGKAICPAAWVQQHPVLTSDGVGGAYVAWQDGRGDAGERVYLQHVNATGGADARWPEQGLRVSASDGEQALQQLGLAGNDPMVVWLEWKIPTDVTVRAQLVLGEGQRDPRWPSEGAVLSTSAVEGPVLLSSGPKSTWAVWRSVGSQQMGSTNLTADPPIASDAEAITMLFAPTPNPARSSVTFRFSLAGRFPARLVVFDVQGRRVATLLDRTLEAGRHEVSWDGVDPGGNHAKSGIYFVRFETRGERFTRRFVLVR